MNARLFPYDSALRLGLLTIGVIGLTACGSSGTPTTVTPPTGTAAAHLYITDGNTSSLEAYALPASGTPAPVTVKPSGIFIGYPATDTNGQIYISTGNSTTNVVSDLVYPANFTSTSTPTRTVTFSDQPEILTVDAAGSLYTAQTYASYVNVYASTASGASSPTRTVTLSSTAEVVDIAVDASNNLYVLIYNTATSIESVSVYATSANGTASPIRTFTLPTATAYYIAVDSAGDVFLSLEPSSTPVQIVEYASTATGAATPAKTINLPYPGSGSESIGKAVVDALGNIYASYQDTGGNHVVVYPSTATGTATPTYTFALTSGFQGYIAVH